MKSKSEMAYNVTTALAGAVELEKSHGTSKPAQQLAAVMRANLDGVGRVAMVGVEGELGLVCVVGWCVWFVVIRNYSGVI